MSATKIAKLKEFGSWSEQTSSSGKRYYYNRETEVSQWEKPTEWKEHEKALMEKYKLSRSSSKTSFSTSQPPPSSSSASAAASKPSAGDVSSSSLAAANFQTPTASSSTSSTPLGPRHHNAFSSSALRTGIGVTTSHNTTSNNNNNVTPSSSQASSSRTRPSESMKRPREDRHHSHHSTSAAAGGSSSGAGSGSASKLVGQQSSSPFATPQSVFDRTGRSGGEKSDKFTSVNGSSALAKSQPTGFTPMPTTRPAAVSGGGGDANSNNLVQSPLSSRYHSCASIASGGVSALGGQRSSMMNTPNSNHSFANSNPAGSGSLASSTSKFRSSADSMKRPLRDDNPSHAPSSKIVCLDASVETTPSSADEPVRSRHITAEKIVEKPPALILFPNAPPFNEAKYIEFYRSELAAYRRNWSSQAYIGEARRYAERSVRQAATLSAIDDDVRSVRSLMGAAELRCALLDQKLAFIRGQIAGLEARNP